MPTIDWILKPRRQLKTCPLAAVQCSPYLVAIRWDMGRVWCCLFTRHTPFPFIFNCWPCLYQWMDTYPLFSNSHLLSVKGLAKCKPILESIGCLTNPNKATGPKPFVRMMLQTIPGKSRQQPRLSLQNEHNQPSSFPKKHMKKTKVIPIMGIFSISLAFWNTNRFLPRVIRSTWPKKNRKRRFYRKG